MAVLYSALAFLPFLFIYFFTLFYRVSLDPVILFGACGAPLARPGGRATISYPPGPRLHFQSQQQFFEISMGAKLDVYHQTLFDCLPYFLNYCFLVISCLLPVFNFFVQISILILLTIFILFFGFLSL